MARDRIHGPYKHGIRWRVVEVRDDGEREVVSFESEAAAHKYIASARRIATGHSVGTAVTAYLEHLRTVPGPRGRHRRESTVRLESWRLLAFLRLSEGDRPIASVTKQVARRLLDLRSVEVKPDTLAGELAATGRWARFCAAKGWVQTDPFQGLVASGERSTGKPQLRVDGARAFLATALGEGSLVGTAAALALLLGLRASEITGLRARDVDDGGRLLWITQSKTRKGIRRLDVPDVLVPRLLALAANKAPDEGLWGDVDRHWLGRHVPRLCEIAKVDRVTPHGLRGTFATLAVGGQATRAVADALGHETPSVTRSAYLAPGAEQSADARRVGTLLEGQFPVGRVAPDKQSN